mmetsp:Transcript_72747/g.118006  ORF Transcript_72747/g.118006 Transcript_72747/m.118006 type:complete len:223 (-) Transcript_72747:2186-2854(-)
MQEVTVQLERHRHGCKSAHIEDKLFHFLVLRVCGQVEHLDLRHAFLCLAIQYCTHRAQLLLGAREPQRRQLLGIHLANPPSGCHARPLLVGHQHLLCLVQQSLHLRHCRQMRKVIGAHCIIVVHHYLCLYARLIYSVYLHTCHLSTSVWSCASMQRIFQCVRCKLNTVTIHVQAHCWIHLANNTSRPFQDTNKQVVTPPIPHQKRHGARQRVQPYNDMAPFL